MLSAIANIDVNKAFFLGERRVRKISAFSFFRGLKKLKGWKKLSGFSRLPSNFKKRVSFEKISLYEFIVLLGELNPTPKNDVKKLWMLDALSYEAKKLNTAQYTTRFPILKEYLERGLIYPFFIQIARVLDKAKTLVDATDNELNICLENQLTVIENLVRRAVVLDLNISSIKGDLRGESDSQKFENFIQRFEEVEWRLGFFQKYPVLFQIVVTKLDLWADWLVEFLTRLNNDRNLIENKFHIPSNAVLESIIPSGDTHNNGRAVVVVEFSNKKTIVYKPRSTNLEFGFQKYLQFFNSVNPKLFLRCIHVLDQGEYGWVEYVEFSNQSTEAESDIYHYRLGFLTALVFSINGVDVFFENLISSGTDPVIIDLETMFHTSIDKNDGKGQVDSLQLLLYDSVTGIGILPQPNQGASESELFDVSVMGARKDAKAPYKVIGIENFGRSDMRITEIPGWIRENKSSSENIFPYKRKAKFLLNGLNAGLNSVMQHKKQLVSAGGVIDKCFAGAKRRLIVRDTKVYGTLQQDETHPDLLRDQIDREWHWDNLWFDLLDRPNLRVFIESELNQLKRGDIPYFSGNIDSKIVMGGDGSTIDLSKIINQTPIQKVKNKLINFSEEVIEDQVRIAATTLGLNNISGVTHPNINPADNVIVNATVFGYFIIKRLKYFGSLPWCDTSFNPAPKVKDFDPVRVVPSDPFLYEGLLGVAMFLHDLSRINRQKIFDDRAVDLMQAIFDEVERKNYFIPSGYAGLSSVVYVINRCIEKGDSSFSIFESKIPRLIETVINKTRDETRLDFLLGISGIASAILPYVRRTSNSAGLSLLKDLLSRLMTAGDKILKSNEIIEGMDYLRGFSHGITGVALSLYRLGEFFEKENAIDLAAHLVIHEYGLVKTGQWTDSHTFEGQPLVGWCHGSAGIALALSVMPKIFSLNETIKIYYDMASENTLSKGVYSSKCLCHGTGGNLLCLGAFSSNDKTLQIYMDQFEKDLLEMGFSSLGAAQTMGIGLMTGLTGAGYYLLGKGEPKVDFGFLTLS